MGASLMFGSLSLLVAAIVLWGTCELIWDMVRVLVVIRRQNAD